MISGCVTTTSVDHLDTASYRFGDDLRRFSRASTGSPSVCRWIAVRDTTGDGADRSCVRDRRALHIHPLQLQIQTFRNRALDSRRSVRARRLAWARFCNMPDVVRTRCGISAVLLVLLLAASATNCSRESGIKAAEPAKTPTSRSATTSSTAA